MAIFPKQQLAAMTAFYGNPGENQVKMMLPYPMRLAWDKSKVVTSVQIHQKAAESLHAILTEIYAKCDNNMSKVAALGLDLLGGTLAIRPKRLGSGLSTHAWGASIDLDPENNQLKWGRDRAKMPEWVIDIFIKHKWVSMGRSKNRDFMHFQAANF